MTRSIHTIRKHLQISGGSRNMWGWNPDRPRHDDPLLPTPLMISPHAILPPHVDLRPKTPRVENQENVGSCVANASTSAYEYLALKQGKPMTQMSRLFLYYATRVWVEGTSASEDNGCQIRDAMEALTTFGCATEKTWPYVLPRFNLAPSPAVVAEALTHQVTRKFRCANLLAIRQSLAAGYPVVFGFAVPASISDYDTEKTGLVKYPRQNEDIVGGHACLIIGYDHATQLVFFENSWGKNWGNNGFGALPYAYFLPEPTLKWPALATDCWTIRGTED